MKYRIVIYCDDTQFAIEQLVEDEWKYVPIYRPRGENMMDVKDMTFDTACAARLAVERLQARDERNRLKEESRIVETM